MIFEELIKENREPFISKVIDISRFIGIRPEWLMFCMWFETGKTLNPAIVNKTTGATGLLQFMPATAHQLGTSVEALAKMTNIQQLVYVKKYFEHYNNKLRSFIDVYLTIFFPLAIGKPDSFVIETKQLHPDIIAKQNPVFDVNKDNQITKAEIKTRLLGLVPEGYKDIFM